MATLVSLGWWGSSPTHPSTRCTHVLSNVAQVSSTPSSLVVVLSFMLACVPLMSCLSPRKAWVRLSWGKPLLSYSSQSGGFFLLALQDLFRVVFFSSRIHPHSPEENSSFSHKHLFESFQTICWWLKQLFGASHLFSTSLLLICWISVEIEKQSMGSRSTYRQLNVFHLHNLSFKKEETVNTS